MTGACAEPGVMDNGQDATCDLEPDHQGPHLDLFEGWEWSD